MVGVGQNAPKWPSGAQQHFEIALLLKTAQKYKPERLEIFY